MKLYLLVLFFSFISHNLFATPISLNQNEEAFLAKEKNINICINPNWLPFDKRNKSKHIGLNAEYLSLISEKINTPFTLVETKDWKESLKKIKNKKCDLITSISKKEKYLEFLNFSKNFHKLTFVLVTKEETPNIIDLAKIKNKTVGIIKNSDFSNTLSFEFENIKIKEYSNIKDALIELQKGRIYAVLDSFSTIIYNLNNHYANNLKISYKFDKKEKLTFAIRKDKPILLNIINKALDKISLKEEAEIKYLWFNIIHKKVESRYTFFILFISIAIISFILIINKKLKDEVEKRVKVEEELNKVISSAQLIIFTLNYKTKEVSFNKIAQIILGYTQEELKNDNLFFNLIHKEDLDNFKYTINNFVKQNEKTFDFEFRVYNKNKDIKWFFCKGSVLEKDKFGDVFLISGMLIDITPKKTLEEEIKQQNKIMTQHSRLAAMGEMIENIAHQWRQPLSAVSTSASSVKLMVELDKLSSKTLVKFMNDIMRSTNYLSDTINDFRNYFSKEKKIEEISTIELIDKSILFIQNRIKNKNIELILNIEETSLITYQNELIQSLINIINNAVDALENSNIEKKFIFITIYKEATNIFITISDNAGGIKEDIISRIFEPYYTTKHKSQGTGIGLYMSQEIIVKHIKGEIFVNNTEYTYENCKYKGAIFTIKINT